MRYILTILLLLFTVNANADIYLILEKTTKDIISLSDKDDAVLPEGNYEKVVVRGDVNALGLTKAPEDYRYINKNFVLNSAKISKRENDRITAEQKSQELIQVYKKAMLMAYEQLKTDGVNFIYIQQEDFE